MLHAISSTWTHALFGCLKPSPVAWPQVLSLWPNTIPRGRWLFMFGLKPLPRGSRRFLSLPKTHPRGRWRFVLVRLEVHPPGRRRFFIWLNFITNH